MPASNTAESPEDRLYCLDGLRGVLALLVVLGHLNYFLGWMDDGSLFALQVRVPAFFALSGFVLYLSSASGARVALKAPVGQFALLRYLRLAPLYYVVLFVAFVLPYLAIATGLAKPGIVPPADVRVPSFFYHLLFLHSWFPDGPLRHGIIAPTWMMGYEFQLSMLAPAFLALVRRMGWMPLLIGASLLTLPGGDHWLGGFFHPSFTFSFLVGLAAARLSRCPTEQWACPPAIAAWCTPDRLIRILIPFTILGVVGIVPIYTLKGGPVFAECLTGATVAAACGLMTLAPRSWLARMFGGRPLRAVGKVSYSLFLVHHPILKNLSFVAGHFHIDSGLPRMLFFLGTIPIIVIATLLTYFFIERPLATAVVAFKKRLTAKQTTQKVPASPEAPSFPAPAPMLAVVRATVPAPLRRAIRMALFPTAPQ